MRAFVCLARSTELEDDVTADHGVLDFGSLLTYITPDDDPVFPALYTMAQAAVPVVKHLNGDTSWLISFPVSTQDREDGLFNIIIDPWLTGPQTDYYSWFSRQSHVIKACVDHISELNTRIDAVVLSHEWSDHTHRATLLEIDAKTPVYATKNAADLVRSWDHFSTVHTIEDLKPGAHWSTTHFPGLPSCLGISRISSTSFEIVSYYHVAICLAYASPDVTQENVDKSKASAVLYSPHGVHAPSLDRLPESGLEVLALMHGLHQVWNPPFLGGMLNLGGLNAVRSIRATKARYWIGTHDEVKKGSGLVSYLLRRKVWTVEEALEEEEKKERGKGAGAKEGTKVGLKYYGLGSGEILRLE
ncbi:hypothetical protein FRC09_020349 [Ceratobasidium sp. 395]|nr:hypothetical protein FRC09_020349 [Ceratobasidium sp. 395]